jgi:polyhydroxybutyrate depolymerase
MVNSRRMVLAAVLAFIGLPVMLALGEAVSYHVVNRSNGSLVSSGETREYLLHVPASYDRTRPTPLVISMHGGALWPAAQMAISQWNDVAEREGFLVVYPSGVGGDGPRHWRVGAAGRITETRFISELIDMLSTSYNIDPARIFADGLSNGGGMAFVLSCTQRDRIAAVGMVAAAHLARWSSCTEPVPMPMIAFHGTADTATPYHGGKSWTAPRPFPDIPAWTANWAGRNRCNPKPIASAVAADVTRLEYPNCVDGAGVVLYTMHGGGHTWPGGGPLPEWFLGPTSHSIDASSEMWAFFREHRLSRP